MAPEAELAEEFEQTKCDEKLKEHPETQPLCGDVHCGEFQESEYYHAACGEKAMYSPVQTWGCYNKQTQEWKWALPKEIKKVCKALERESENWELEQCFCCCSCFADQTPIGLPENLQRPIGEISVGDQILAGKVAAGKVEWDTATVRFSQGTENGHQPAMTYIVYGDGEQLIASPDQPLMLADGSLTTAARLTPGQELKGIDGNPLSVALVSLGGYDGGVHHIATDTEWDGSIDDHLIQANGVVAGDFTLQLHFRQVAAEAKVADWESLPEIGTAEYLEANADVKQLGETEVFGAEQTDLAIEDSAFKAYGPVAELPLETQSFVTHDQAGEILLYGKQAPITEQSGYALAEEAIALVRGFYPGFVYYLDWNRAEPNVYAFEQYGQKVILVSGGLARMKGFGFTGLTMAVGHAVGRFLGGDPKATDSFSCTGTADLFAFGAVSRKVWFGSYWLKQCLAAEEQLSALLGLIKHRGGNPHNVCGEPSIECREETWVTALSGEALPECAGGEPLPPITLEKASGIDAEHVQLVFSQPPRVATAEELGNYSLTPAAKVTAAKVDAKKNFIVNLTVEGLEPGTYKLSCTNLESVFGGKLKPDPDTVEFEIEAK